MCYFFLQFLPPWFSNVPLQSFSITSTFFIVESFTLIKSVLLICIIYHFACDTLIPNLLKEYQEFPKIQSWFFSWPVQEFIVQ